MKRMSYLNNPSDDLEKNSSDFHRIQNSLITKRMAAAKVSSEPKWIDKREDDSGSEMSDNEAFLAKGMIRIDSFFLFLIVLRILPIWTLPNALSTISHEGETILSKIV